MVTIVEEQLLPPLESFLFAFGLYDMMNFDLEYFCNHLVQFILMC